VRALKTGRTVALYLNTPSNPTGRLIPRSWIEALVAWAAREDLWILADEVYEDYVYEGEHVYTRPLAPERTFAANMTDDFLQLVDREPGLGGSAFGSVDVHGVELGERRDSRLDVLGRQADLRGQVRNVRIFAELTQDTVENAHFALHAA